MNKYRNKKTVVDGITFDSKKEAGRYQELKLMERAGQICEIELQPVYELRVNHLLVCKYKADFRYGRFLEPGEKWDRIVIIEDVKGMKTPVYNLKKKLMKACHGIEITEI